MRINQRSLLIILLIGLTSCSGAGSLTEQPTTRDSEAPTLGAVQLPPTWTSTPRPTQSPATMTPNLPLEGTELPESTLSFNLPNATPVSASIAITTWQNVEGATASFMLPASFEVLDMGSEFGMIMAALMGGLMEGMVDFANELGQEFGAEPITPTPIDLSEVEAAFNIDFVVAMESDQITSAFLFSEPTEKTPVLEEQIESLLDEQENPMEVVSMDRIVEGPYEMGRIHLLSTDLETGEHGQLLIYVILLPDRIYQLGYATSLERFMDMLPVFETSASTFTVFP